MTSVFTFVYQNGNVQFVDALTPEQIQAYKFWYYTDRAGQGSSRQLIAVVSDDGSSPQPTKGAPMVTTSQLLTSRDGCITEHQRALVFAETGEDAFGLFNGFCSYMSVLGEVAKSLKLRVDVGPGFYQALYLEAELDFVFRQVFTFDDNGVLDLECRMKLSKLVLAGMFNAEQTAALMPYMIGIPCLAGKSSPESRAKLYAAS